MQVEITGIAGVGKSHLAAALARSLGPSCVTVESCRIGTRHLGGLPSACYRFAPMFVYLLTSARHGSGTTLGYALRWLRHAWRERRAANAATGDAMVLAEEGWFHKLREVRRLAGRDVAYHDLPATVRRRLFRAHAVLLLTADDEEVCARKLRRKGHPVTPATLARQYRESAELGQWTDLERTRRDLEQARASNGIAVIEIDYRPGYDVETELLPRLRLLGAFRSEPGAQSAQRSSGPSG